MTVKPKPSQAISTGLLIGVVVLSLVVPVGVLAQDQGETEPNDARATATPLTDSINGEITEKGGVDWYSAEFTRGELVSFFLTKPATEPELSISLYGPNGEQLFDTVAIKNDSRAQAASTANQTGTYYVRVEASNTSHSGIPYTVRIASATEPARQGGEPNDAQPGATSLQNTYAHGVLSGMGDTDWYSAEFTKGEPVSFLISDKHVSEMDVEIRIYSYNGTELKSKLIDGDSTRGQIAITANRTGRYYLLVWSYSDSRLESPIPYTVRVAGTGAPPETTPSTATVTVTATQKATSRTATQTATSTSPTDQPTQTATARSADAWQTPTPTPEKESSGMISSDFVVGFIGAAVVIVVLAAVAVFVVRRQ